MRMTKTLIPFCLIVFFSVSALAANDHPYEESFIYNFSEERITVEIVSENKKYRLGRNHQMRLEYTEAKKLLRIYQKNQKICEYVVDDRYDLFITGLGQARCERRAERLPKEF